MKNQIEQEYNNSSTKRLGVTRKFHVLIVQSNGKEKCATRAKFFFLLIRKKCAARAKMFFC